MSEAAQRRTRTVTRTVNGSHQTRIEHYTVTITDFDFSIDLTDYITFGPVFWTYPDEVPAYRGLPVRQVDAPPVNASADVEEAEGRPKTAARRKATKDEIKAFKVDEHAHINEGIPPWENRDRTTRWNRQASSKSLREWADEYAASPKLLKEFLFEKVQMQFIVMHVALIAFIALFQSLYGWNATKLQSAIISSIHSTSYTGIISTTFLPSLSRIAIRPDNRLSRTLSSTLYKVLLWIFLIYPFIWLFKRFHSRGGGRWEVCGGAYPLKQWVPLEAGEAAPDVGVEDLEGLPSYAAAAYGDGGLSAGAGMVVTRRASRFMQTTTGPKKLVGLKEGEWFRSWEGVITRAVIGRYQSSVPIPRTNSEASALDGYNETLVRY
ncbi:hypothetical protein NLJ89_g11988 [Agrocybe chaxingu]|uniref:Uncharacterized protein n=1 Tax=Agrocybe chaxingu TaxID=84603 RepID=A0A9W8JMQ5_9AGAR|nr:hypothetical protein NLJ89_g11988 [Agrocybe chaxingu]